VFAPEVFPDGALVLLGQLQPPPGDLAVGQIAEAYPAEAVLLENAGYLRFPGTCHSHNRNEFHHRYDSL
jgi:hypothetical protein